jgi:hypothetical protein
MIHISNFEKGGIMATAPARQKEELMVTEVQLTKRAGPTTKRAGPTTKRLAEMLMGDYSESGAYGDYTVTKHGGERIQIKGAMAIRVLDRGELNLLTDTGRWYLFAPNEWQTAFPTQPEPGKGN